LGKNRLLEQAPVILSGDCGIAIAVP